MQSVLLNSFMTFCLLCYILGTIRIAHFSAYSSIYLIRHYSSFSKGQGWLQQKWQKIQSCYVYNMQIDTHSPAFWGLPGVCVDPPASKGFKDTLWLLPHTLRNQRSVGNNYALLTCRRKCCRAAGTLPTFTEAAESKEDLRLMGNRARFRINRQRYVNLST